MSHRFDILDGMILANLGKNEAGVNVPERVELETGRLRLRRAREGDANALFINYTSDNECARFLQRRPHSTVGQTELLLRKLCVEAWDSPEVPFSWVIAKRESGEAIGLFLAFPNGHRTDFHYGIGRRFWGQGLATEAGHAALNALWRSESTQRLWSFCDVENVGSRRILEKLGLACEGVLKRWAVFPAFGTAARDCFVYGVGREADLS